MNTKKKLKHLKLFDQHKVIAAHNRVRPVNDFREFRKEDINQSICECFEKKARACPGKIAVKSGDKSITYQFLNNYANRLAHAIAKTGKKPAGPTRHAWQAAALLFDHGTEMIIGMMGVLKAGITYVPLDPTYPRDRLGYILADSMVRLIVTHASYFPLARQLKNSAARPIEIININNFDGEMDPAAAPSPGITIHPDQVAYVLYTSGSTGKPKGVMQNHKNVLHFARVYTNALHIHGGDRLTLLSSYSFDAAKMDIFGALLNGAGLYPYDVKQEGNLERLSGWLNREKITIYHSIPTLYRYFIGLLPDENQKNRTFPYIRFVVMGGEAVTRNDVEKYKKYFSPDCIFINGLGPTESTVTLEYFIDKKSRIDKSCVPVGFPVEETQVFLLDKNNEPTVVNAVGEIVYKSDYLALGYLNQPGKTNEAFGKDPITNNGRIYRSGDLGIRLANGNTQYVGREDSQVKIRGYRIELGEIETQLSKHESIKDAVVINKENGNGETCLCAYLVTQQNFASGQVRNFLSAVLPNHMIPSYFLTLDRIPLTPSGKVDRKALPPVDPAAANEYTAPTDTLEERLVEIWSDVLGIDESKIGTNANFFQLGGHSLKASILTSGIHKRLQVKVPLTEIFRRQTIRELSEYIKGTVKEKYAGIEPVEKKEYYSLSSAQKRLYFIQQMDANSTNYNMPLILSAPKDTDTGKVEAVIKKLIARHESLRTSFEQLQGVPVQRIHEPGNIDFSVDYYKSDEAGAQRIINNYIRPFDLARAPLLRAGLIVLPAGNQAWIVDIPHIVLDGTSQMLLAEEFQTLDKSVELAPLRIHYKDFSQWQDHLFQSGGIKIQEEYWLEHFTHDDEIPRLDFSTSRQRPTIFTFEGGRYEFVLDGEETRKFKDQGARYGATLFMNFLIALNILFYKYTGQQDIIIGTAIAGRPHADLQSIIGMFVNMLAMRNNPKAEQTYGSFLKEVVTNSVKAFENQDVQFEALVEKLELPGDLSRNPVFDISLVLRNFRQVSRDERVSNREQEGIPRPTPPAAAETRPTFTQQNITSNFDMTFFVGEREDDIRVAVEYYTAIFDEPFIQRLVSHLKYIIKGVTENPQARLKDISILSEEEKTQMLETFNNTGSDYPRDKTIHELYAEQVRRNPDYLALVGPRQMKNRTQPAQPADMTYISYQELDKKAHRLADLLIEKNVRPGTIVGIMVERSIEMIIGILGILKAGGAYLPIDPAYPPERKNYMIKDSGAKILLTGKEIAAIYSPPAFNNRPEGTLSHLHLSLAPATSLAYIIYTSGSTGKPKGVLIEHRAVHNFMEGMTRIIEFKPGEIILALTTITFDIFGLETLLPLCRGLKVVLADENHQREMGLLEQLVVKNCVGMMQTTPTRMQMFTMTGSGRSCLGNLKEIMVGGEVLPVELLSDLKQSTPAKIYNMYGPTETTIWSTVKELTGAKEINIGTPIQNTVIYIFDQHYHLQPVGVPGEICIGGDGLARGYINRPQLTAERFVINSKIKTKNSRLYHTGDLAKWQSDGNIEFLGRMDQQVKLRGFRIELGEIEQRLQQYNKINQAVVLVKKNNGNKYLCAYVAAQEEIDQMELRDFLAAKLPNYMVPSYFHQLEEIPLTHSGKVDRRALPKPEIKTGDLYVPPQTEMEKKIVEMWGEVLGIDKKNIGMEANFFEMGGNSLNAMIFLGRINKEFEVNVPLADFFRTPQARKLITLMKRQNKNRYTSLDPVEKKEYYRLSSAQKRMVVLQQIDLKATNYNISRSVILEGDVSRKKLEEVFKQLISWHEALRTLFILSGEEYIQRVRQHVDFEIEYHDFTFNNSPSSKAEKFVKGFKRAFDLSRAPLLRCGLIKISEEEHILIVDMHHIISDGVSMNILVRNFARLYSGEDLSCLRLRYGDYSEWQNSESQKSLLKQQEKYWLGKLAGDRPLFNLPTDYNKPETQNFEGGIIEFEINETLFENIKKIASKTGTTLFMLLLAAYNVLLTLYSEKQDILVGTPVTGRPHIELQEIMGMFVNMLVMRNFPTKNKTFADFLGEVKENTLEAFRNGDYQFDELVDKLGLKRNITGNPLIDTVFTLQNTASVSPAREEGEALEFKIKPYSNRMEEAKFDLTLDALESGNILKMWFTYYRPLFKRTTIEKMKKYYLKILEQVAQNIEIKIGDISIYNDLAESSADVLREDKGDFDF